MIKRGTSILLFSILFLASLSFISSSTTYYPNSTGGLGWRESTASANLYSWSEVDATSYSSEELNNVSLDDTLFVNEGSFGGPSQRKVGHRFRINISESISSITNISLLLKEKPTGASIDQISFYIGNVSDSSWYLLNQTNSPAADYYYLTNSVSTQISNFINNTSSGNFIYLLAFSNSSMVDSLLLDVDFVQVNITTPAPSINLDLITPLTNINATRNAFFPVTVNVTCKNAACGDVNVSLDPTTTAIEDFEDGDISNYFGNTTYAAVRAANNREGSYGLNMTLEIDFNYPRLIFRNDTNLTRGSNFSWSMGLTDNTLATRGVGFLFGVQDYNNYYSFTCWANTCSLYRVKTGGRDLLQNSGAFTIDVNIWYDYNLTWRTDGNITIYKNDTEAVISVIDNNYTTGGFGFLSWETMMGGPGTTIAFFDYLTQTSSSVSKGLIPIGVGDPFYTNKSSNPFTINLDEDESELVTFWVNATGQANSSVYDFFAYVNQTANQSISNITSHWNVSIINDTTAPVISLISPANENSTNLEVIFKYNVTDESTISNCSLILNNVINETKTSITNATTLNFTKSLATGNYNWSINCTDSWANKGNSSSRNISVDITAPTITITSPTGTYTTNSYSISITINEAGTCVYNVGGSNQTLTTTDNLIFTSSASDVSNGNYVLTAYCNDSLGNANSTTSSFTINKEDTGGGGGGTIEDICDDRVTCTDFGKCINGTQTRECTTPLNFCNRYFPNLTRTCEIENKTCTDWSNCDYSSSLGDTITQSYSVIGKQTRTCTFQGQTETEEKICSKKEPIILEIVSSCNRTSLQISNINNTPIAMISENSANKNTGFDVLFLTQGRVGCEDLWATEESEIKIFDFFNWLPIAIWCSWILFTLSMLIIIYRARQEISYSSRKIVYWMGK